jgi:glutathione synthase/RimK-type ligase-like ATP-grasp enzyme
VLALGIYREAQFSPGKVDADAAILDRTLASLAEAGIETVAVRPDSHDRYPIDDIDLVLAMCQGERQLERLASFEKSGALVINSALAIRNCYRDLLGAGLMRARVPAPRGLVIDLATGARDVTGLDSARGLYVKRGDLHALGPDDVQRVDGPAALDEALESFARRAVRQVYIQQAVVGTLVKFYGVSGGEYFAALPEYGVLARSLELSLRLAAERAAAALGLEVWGGDAIVSGDDLTIVDFNDWPSFNRVREVAGPAIARRALRLLRRRES